MFRMDPPAKRTSVLAGTNLEKAYKSELKQRHMAQLNSHLARGRAEEAQAKADRLEKNGYINHFDCYMTRRAAAAAQLAAKTARDNLLTTTSQLNHTAEENKKLTRRMRKLKEAHDCMLKTVNSNLLKIASLEAELAVVRGREVNIASVKAEMQQLADSLLHEKEQVLEKEEALEIKEARLNNWNIAIHQVELEVKQAQNLLMAEKKELARVASHVQVLLVKYQIPEKK
jgi:DNA-binding Lrp family transcriptional regulator